MKDFDAVVFDMDGIIFDSERCILDCWVDLAEKYGIKDIKKNFLLCTGTNAAKTRQIMLDAYGPGFSYDSFAKEASAIFHEKYDNGKLPMKTGVFELLDFLKGSGKKIALATSTRRESVMHQLKHAGVLEYFEEIVTGDMVSNSKPHPEIYLKSCEKIGVDPHRAFAIEDSYNGIRSAHAGGLHPIMVPDLLPADEEMKELSEAVIEDLLKVRDYLAD